MTNYKLCLIELMIIHYGDECKICGGPFNEEDPPTIDHIIPKNQGGTDNLSNLQLAHGPCNTSKGGGQDRHKVLVTEKTFVTDAQILETLKHFPYRRGASHIQAAAAHLGVHPRTIYRRLIKLGEQGKLRS